MHECQHIDCFRMLREGRMSEEDKDQCMLINQETRLKEKIYEILRKIEAKL